VCRLPVDRLPRVTIVTPSFQQGAFIEDTIRSVLDQRGVHIDYIVQDGGSTDGSVDVIRRHAAQLAHWETESDSGQAAAVIRGFSHVANDPDDVMMYLNSDDILMRDAVRFVAEFFAQHPEVDVVYGHRILIDEAGAEIGRWLTPRPAFIDLRLHDFIPQETLFWRRRIWDRIGGLDPSFAFALDWDLLLRFQAAGARFARLPWFLAAFRVHPAQKTNRCLEEVGIAEMEALRQRTLGRSATHDELHLAMRSAQFDSALVCALWRREWRI
jgi:glycosyltransferase involved in cell wall biosynthesis